MIPTRVDRCPKCGHSIQQRTLEQNDKFHALIQDISEQKEWAGSLRAVNVWKQLISAAYERTRDHHAEMFPSIDGHGVDVVYWHSSRRSKQDMSDLIEFTTAWAISNGVSLQKEAA